MKIRSVLYPYSSYTREWMTPIPRQMHTNINMLENSVKEFWKKNHEVKSGIVDHKWTARIHVKWVNNSSDSLSSWTWVLGLDSNYFSCGSWFSSFSAHISQSIIYLQNWLSLCKTHIMYMQHESKGRSLTVKVKLWFTFGISLFV